LKTSLLGASLTKVLLGWGNSNTSLRLQQRSIKLSLLRKTLKKDGNSDGRIIRLSRLSIIEGEKKSNVAKMTSKKTFRILPF